MLDELSNVVQDILTANSASIFPLEHRGHVVAVAYMCALDAISSYGYKNRNVQKFVRQHFPNDYKRFASRIYPDYRLNLVHAWNLFGEAALLPGNQPIQEQNGAVYFADEITIGPTRMELNLSEALISLNFFSGNSQVCSRD